MSQTDWCAPLCAIEAEGISTHAYAQREGLSLSALYYWRKRLKTEAPAPDKPPLPQLVAVQISEQAVIGQRCTLWLVPGVRLELSSLPSATWLAQVAGAVSQQDR